MVFALSFTLIGIRCKTTTITETTAAATTAAPKTTAAPEGAYDYYEMLRASAIRSEAYPDAPTTGYSLAFTAFADIMGGLPFTNSVWADTQK